MTGLISAKGAAQRVVEIDEQALTARSLFQLDYIPPPPRLHPWITTLYWFRCEERMIRDTQPAGAGHLMIFLRGEGVIRFGERADRSFRVSLLSPSGAATPFDVAGPFHCVGAALSPLGWAAFTGLHARRSADRLLNGADIFGPAADDWGEQLARRYAAGTDGTDLCSALVEFIEARLKPVPARHITLMQTVAGWLGSSLDPPYEELERQANYSSRQLQRLVERYFGQSPVGLKRKYRALRVAALLDQPELDAAQFAELAAGFYDQSHMIRELRIFTGRTPGRLAEDDGSILKALLHRRNYTEVSPNIAPLPEAFSGEEG
ncbi:MAG: helix-turn-helix domain-containing protein [Erythrobacter sp.]